MLVNLAHETINLLRIPFHHQMDPPIRKILHISRDLISGGNSLRRVAETHSLKENLPLFHNFGLLVRSSRNELLAVFQSVSVRLLHATNHKHSFLHYGGG